jgi:hypothetical protein
MTELRILTWREYSGLSKCLPYNQKGLCKREARGSESGNEIRCRKHRSEGEIDRGREGESFAEVLVALEMEEDDWNHRVQVTSKAQKNKEMCFPLELPKEIQGWAHLHFDL